MAKQQHAVCVPVPAQGHIGPMVVLAKLLHRNGFHITFVNTHFNHSRLLRSLGPSALDGLPSFRFTSIPDGLPPSDPDATQDIPSLCRATETHFLDPFTDLLRTLVAGDSPPVTCVVADIAMGFTIQAAQEFHLPLLLFHTASTSSLLAFCNYRNLLEKGLVPLKDAECLTNGYLETTVDWIPEMEGIRLRDLPPFIRTTDRDDFQFNFVIRMVDRVGSSPSAVLINTFDELDHRTINELRSLISPPIFAIGPLHLHLTQFHDGEEDLSSIKSNLWKEEMGCLDWLDSKECSSVLYVSFGSITPLTKHQLIEFAWGLANSGHNFLWVMRPDLVMGKTAVLPAGFLTETKDRGFLVEWCPQEQVLSHPSVGGFLTHCGWNSTVESLSSGVPMLCWPFFADQQTTCWFACRKWGVAKEIGGDPCRDEIDKLVRELMEGDEGKKMRKKAHEWKAMGHEAVMGPNGPSHLNLKRVIDLMLQGHAS